MLFYIIFILYYYYYIIVVLLDIFQSISLISKEQGQHKVEMLDLGTYVNLVGCWWVFGAPLQPYLT